MKQDTEVYVEFKDGSSFKGYLCLNPFTGYLVFDNDSGQFNVEEKAIAHIEFIDSSLPAQG